MSLSDLLSEPREEKWEAAFRSKIKKTIFHLGLMEETVISTLKETKNESLIQEVLKEVKHLLKEVDLAFTQVTFDGYASGGSGIVEENLEVEKEAS